MAVNKSQTSKLRNGKRSKKAEAPEVRPKAGCNPTEGGACCNISSSFPKCTLTCKNEYGTTALLGFAHQLGLEITEQAAPDEADPNATEIEFAYAEKYKPVAKFPFHSKLKRASVLEESPTIPSCKAKFRLHTKGMFFDATVQVEAFFYLLFTPHTPSLSSTAPPPPQTKGAPDFIIKLSTKIMDHDGSIRDITEADRELLDRVSNKMASEQLRT